MHQVYSTFYIAIMIFVGVTFLCCLKDTCNFFIINLVSRVMAICMYNLLSIFDKDKKGSCIIMSCDFTVHKSTSVYNSQRVLGIGGRKVGVWRNSPT